MQQESLVGWSNPGQKVCLMSMVPAGPCWTLAIFDRKFDEVLVPARDHLDPGGGQTSMDPASCGALVVVVVE